MPDRRDKQTVLEKEEAAEGHLVGTHVHNIPMGLAPSSVGTPGKDVHRKAQTPTFEPYRGLDSRLQILESTAAHALGLESVEVEIDCSGPSLGTGRACRAYHHRGVENIHGVLVTELDRRGRVRGIPGTCCSCQWDSPLAEANPAGSRWGS